MLEPAVMHREKLHSLFAKTLYDDNYFYYAGYPYDFEIPEIKPEPNVYEWAIVDSGKVIGYLVYRIDPFTDCVSRFGLYSFDQGNPTTGIDVYKKIESLISRHHRIEWRVIEGNPVVRHYDKLCSKHNGNKIVLHDVTKDLDGTYKDEYIYEIINNHNNTIR